MSVNLNDSIWSDSNQNCLLILTYSALLMTDVVILCGTDEEMRLKRVIKSFLLHLEYT